MKKTAWIIILILTLPVTMIIVTQPEKPVTNCNTLNKDLSRLCLSHMPKYYDAGFLTYIGHTKAWIYRRANKSGISLGKQQMSYLVNYSFFEDAINCHMTTSGDANLNMTMTPTEFDAAYKSVANDYRADK